MSECQNVAVRDRLPEYLHDALEDEAEVAMIRAHLDLCAECAEELAVMEAALATAPAVPAIDVARIVAAIPAYRAAEATPAAGSRATAKAERRWFGRFDRAAVRIAAGFLIAAAGLSAVAVSRHHQAAPTSATPAGVALVNVSELSDDNLEQLIKSMDDLDGTPPSEPEVVPAAATEGTI